MIEDANRKCLLCDDDMPAWSVRSVCYKHPFGNLDHRPDETSPAAGGPVAGRGDEARGNQSATTDPAHVLDKARVLRGNLEKAREILADYDAGRPLQVTGDGWLVRFANHIVSPLPAPDAGWRGDALPIDRETLGRMVREAWVRWALTQPNPKPSWLAPYDDLSEPDKEADRQIGEAICKWTVIHHEARAALPAPPVGDGK